MEIADVIDISSPESHCNQDHDHFSLPWALPECTWEDQLVWAQGDNGYNEGAAVGAQIALQYGLGLPPEVVQLAGDALANAWPRSDMMQLASSAVKAGFTVPGASPAIASQWHNCHAFKCSASFLERRLKKKSA